MDRLADVLHISFAVRPEWNPNEPLHWSNIHVETIESRQIQQLPGWADVVQKLTNIIQEELGVAHIMQFKNKLSRVSPTTGYQVDPETHRSLTSGIVLAASGISAVSTNQVLVVNTHSVAITHVSSSRAQNSRQISDPPSPSPLPSSASQMNRYALPSEQNQLLPVLAVSTSSQVSTLRTIQEPSATIVHSSTSRVCSATAAPLAPASLAHTPVREVQFRRGQQTGRGQFIL
jgi:hypothetical protein